MRRRLRSHWFVHASVVWVAATVVLLGQVPGPLGVADASARQFLVDAVLGDAFRTYQSNFIVSDFVLTVARAYAKIPAAARGPATTAAFAWARSYLSSPAFAAAYAKQREGQRPPGAPTGPSIPGATTGPSIPGAPTGPSIDDALKKMMDDQLATQAEVRKMAASLPEKDRAAMLANLKEQEARLKSPETQKMWRTMLEIERGENSSGANTALAAWEARYPANPNAFVREHLQIFLKETAKVDYSIAAFMVRGPSGEVLGFLSPGYTGIPWQHIHAIVAGKDAVDAGRAAAAAWLKEIESK